MDQSNLRKYWIVVNKEKVYIRKNIESDYIDTINSFDKDFANEIRKSILSEVILNANEKMVVDYKTTIKSNTEVNMLLKSIADELMSSGNSKKKITEIIVRKERKETLNIINKDIEDFAKKEKVAKEEWEKDFNKSEFDDMKTRDINKLKSENINKSNESAV